ncbi:MAG: DNA repair protein RecN [Fimbriimonadaceae bacterium]
MLLELSVENIAIIDRAQLALGPGFTALTGETGAGKSLLVDAIELVLGARADSDLVRAGATRGTVAATFDLTSHPDLQALCRHLGVEPEGGCLYLQREVLAEGRSTCRIAGRMVPLSTMRQIGAALVDLHGQHDHQDLLDPVSHVRYLDAWIGEPAAALLAQVAERFAAVSEVERKLHALSQDRRGREQRIDLLRFQVQEIESVDPVPGEMPELEARLGRLQHVERLAEVSAASLARLVDEEGAAVERLGTSVRELESVARHDPEIEESLEAIRSALYALQEGARTLRAYADRLEADPEALDATASRIDDLKRLRRKYGDDEAAILAFYRRAKLELEDLDNSETTESELQERLKILRSELQQSVDDLTALRREKAARFAEEVQTQIRELAMERAVFTVGLSPRPIDATGGDEVVFLFSANAGEPPRPLNKIASGGEISRVMLAMKSVLAGTAGVPTLIFDEVDTGLGGRAAAVVARKLEALGEHYQVVVISHLPQIASRASSHFRIEKGEESGRATTRVVPLADAERVQEIARMIAGERVGDSAVAHAREMLGLG